jgi:hypothetical protein
MTQLSLSTRNIFRILAAWTVLSLAMFACGAGAPGADSPEEPPAAIASTQEPVLEEPSESESPPDVPPLVVEPTQQPAPAIPERRRLTLEYPSRIRAGDSDLIRLTLEVDDLGNVTPTAQFGGDVVTGEVVEIPNLYETHNVIAEARFDIAGLQVSPPELISQTLSRGQAVNFIWSVRPTEAGTYRGTVWFYLRFVDKVSGEESQITVSAQLVEIEAVNLLGLPANLVRTAGGVGSVIGAVIGFPFFEDILRFILGRGRRKKLKI